MALRVCSKMGYFGGCIERDKDRGELDRRTGANYQANETVSGCECQGPSGTKR